MKTPRKVFRTMIQLLMLSVLLFFTQSCETEIPLEDNTPPEFSFQITGPGVNYTFDEDFDFRNHHLRLKPGAAYTFTFTGGDSGGVRVVKWTMNHKSYIDLLEEIPSPWNLIETEREHKIIWYGDRNNPLTGSVLTGSLRPRVNSLYTAFEFEVSDFGGDRGTPNTTSERLSVYLTHYHLGVRRNL